MAEKNIGYIETSKILDRELEMFGLAFRWVYAHYALKRSFFFSILKSRNYLNMPFRRKDVKNPSHCTRWGNGIKVSYPAVKLMLRGYYREMFRHPFFRALTTRNSLTKAPRDKVFPIMGKKISFRIKKSKFLKRKKIIRRNNILIKMVGASYMSYKPFLLFKLNRFNKFKICPKKVLVRLFLGSTRIKALKNRLQYSVLDKRDKSLYREGRDRIRKKRTAWMFAPMLFFKKKYNELEWKPWK